MQFYVILVPHGKGSPNHGGTEEQKTDLNGTPSNVMPLVFRNFGLFNFAGTFPELTENLGVSSAELTNRDSRSSLPDPTRWPNRKQ